MYARRSKNWSSWIYLTECQIYLTHHFIIAVLDRSCYARKPNQPSSSSTGLVVSYDFLITLRTYNRMMGIIEKTRQFETMVAMLLEMGKKDGQEGLFTMETFRIGIRSLEASKEREKTVGLFYLMDEEAHVQSGSGYHQLPAGGQSTKLGKETNPLFEKLKERFTPNI
ncbi:hypothetical protein SAY87_023507 [Trapa incisa]|uniref:Uncharacterized protein n=1 Tax=Trapa incisa TaxID=236973 RepID=A0AAN7QS74_9MYRT|nr:hypothetical protein SAY87_023507 [Trapa incisa]